MATHVHADGTIHEGSTHDNVHENERAAVQYERDTRKTLGKGHIRGLDVRLTPEQAAKRQAKILARRTVAEALTHQTGHTLGLVLSLRPVLLRQQRWLIGLTIAAIGQALAFVYEVLR